MLDTPESLQTNFVPQVPEADVKGCIPSIYGGVAESGRNTIIAISNGSEDGLAMVFRTFDKISYALIMQATEPVNVLECWRNYRRHQL